MTDELKSSPEVALRAEGVRMTRQRFALLTVVCEAEDHPDAGEIHRRVRAIDPSVSLSTAYRTMSMLERRGVIQRHRFDGAPARFESADERHNGHIIDVDTGEVVEFHSPEIERLEAQIAAKLDCEVVHRRLELYCRGATRSGPPSLLYSEDRRAQDATLAQSDTRRGSAPTSPENLEA